eukprot:15230-Heterococcus_DN1.PRE.2
MARARTARSLQGVLVKLSHQLRLSLHQPHRLQLMAPLVVVLLLQQQQQPPSAAVAAVMPVAVTAVKALPRVAVTATA